ncbi:MAG: LolA family protein [Planctomycetota bacterium]|jgi:outer membrane lipoprotein-sorting protein
MKPQQDDKWLDAAIKRAVGSERAEFDADGWVKKHRREVASLASQHTPSAAGRPGRRTWRSVMHNRRVKVAASVAVAAGIAVAAVILAIGGGSTVAMAEALAQLRTRCYAFDLAVKAGPGASASVKGMVLEPGKMRLEQRGGLGTVVGIVDNSKGQSLILMERFGAAYRFDRKEAKEIGPYAFLILPGRSIEDLWSLKAGDETALGRKDIDGRSAEGFQVTQAEQEYTQTITLWADAKTGRPLRVEIALKPHEQDKGALEMTLSGFREIPKPDPALFSTEVPKGYTLAGRRTLEQLAAQADASGPPAEGASPQAKAVLDAIALWAEGSGQEAVKLLVGVDWGGDFRFGREHHLFTLTEREYISLLSADQQKVMSRIMKQSSQCMDIARHLVGLGQQARAAGDAATAEKYFATAASLGRLLNRHTDMMLIVRLTGIGMENLAVKEMSSLYEQLGETKKRQEAEARVRQLRKQFQQIKKKVSGR